MKIEEKEKLISAFVLEKCHKKDFIHSDWYWEEHIQEVVRLCKMFGENLKSNMDILIPAAYLHDIGKILGLENHAETGAAESKNYLSEIGFSSDDIEKISTCIKEHSCDKFAPSSLESKILASCDAASHFTTLFMEIFFYESASGFYPDRDSSFRGCVEGNVRKGRDDWKKISIPEIQDFVRNDYECFKRRYKFS